MLIFDDFLISGHIYDTSSAVTVTIMSSTNWVDFFTDAGLPSKFAQKYAVLFNEHRIRDDMLKDVNKEILADMGIRTMGDVIAILRHAKEVAEEDNKLKVLGQSSKSSSSTASTRESATSFSNLNKEASASNSRTVLPPASSGISTQLAKRLGPTDIGAPAKRRAVESNVDFGAVGRGAIRKVTPPANISNNERVVVKVGLPSRSRITLGTPPTAAGPSTPASGSKNVFNRLGGSNSATPVPEPRTIRLGGSGLTKATATVKPTTVTSARATAAPYSVKDRLGGGGSGTGFRPSSDRGVVSSNLRFKNEEPKPAAKPRIVTLKKSIFDRLN